MTSFGRLLTAMVTPFTDNGQVDFAQAVRLAKGLVASGSDGLVISGTTGESPTLSTDEKVRLFAEIKAAIGANGKVVAGTGNYNTAESIHLTHLAEQAGADGVLLVVPYYNKPPQEGLYQHFKAIANSTHLPAIVYNVPSRTALNMTADTVIRLSAIENIVGLKEASGNLEQAGDIIQRARRGFVVYSGNDQDTLPLLSIGGYGVISVASHLVGERIASMIRLAVSGQYEEASALHRDMIPLVKALFTTTNPIPLKAALNIAGFNVGKPRLPLVELDTRQADALRTLLSHSTLDRYLQPEAATVG